MLEEKTKEKRKDEENICPIFRTRPTKQRKIEEVENNRTEDPLDRYYEGGRKKTEEELKQEWIEKLKRR